MKRVKRAYMNYWTLKAKGSSSAWNAKMLSVHKRYESIKLTGKVSTQSNLE